MVTRTEIRNAGESALTLPTPLRGVLGPSQAVVSSFSPSVLAELFGEAVRDGAVRVRELVTGSVTPGLESPTDMRGLDLRGLPSVPPDDSSAASKAWVLSVVGGGARAIGWFDIRDFGALASPNDIGAAVNAAFPAAIAFGGGTVFIPPRADGVRRGWGWTTGVSADAADGMSLFLQGIRGQTIIQIEVGQPPLLDFGHSNAFLGVDGFVFAGVNANGINASNILYLRQGRIGSVTNCAFYSIACDGDLFGLVRITADTTYVDNLLFMGCGFFGTQGLGGVLTSRGHRDGARVLGSRFMTMDGQGFNGNTINKSSATGAHLWIGASGTNPDVIAIGEVGVDTCYFDANAAQLIFINGEGAAIDRVRTKGNCFNCASNNQAAVYAGTGDVRQLISDGDTFGNSAAGQIAIDFAGGKLRVRDSYATAGGKLIRFRGPTTFVELDESPGFTFDTSIATPAHGITWVNGVMTTVFP